MLCRVLKVSRSGFYAAQSRPPSRRSTEDLALRAHIVRLHEEHRFALGSLKMWHMLNKEGIVCGKHRVARLRALEGIEAARRAKFRNMLAHQHSEPPAPDLVQRAFTVASPNVVWVADMTTIHTREGWLHLAVVLDLFARRIVGWAMSSRQNAELPITALVNAIEQRRPDSGLICHTDQGSVYGSKDYTAVLAEHEIQQSMSRKGNCHDNAVVESFFSTLKNEHTHLRVYDTRTQAIAGIADYIALYYNRLRPHQTLGYRSPIDVEMKHLMLN